MTRYVSERIGTDYCFWGKGNVFFQMPTGMGKSSFITETMVPYIKKRGGKTLILCNRRLLQDQYMEAAYGEYYDYGFLQESFDVITYQSMGEKLMNGNMDRFLADYTCVVFDEYHYFRSDSLFNSFGSYPLLQALIKSCFYKLCIFMSCTGEGVIPVIKECIHWCSRQRYVKFGENSNTGRWNYSEIFYYNFMEDADYSRFNCLYSEHLETILMELSGSSEKSILFIDNKKIGEECRNQLMEYGVDSEDIIVLHAENLESNATFVKELVSSRKLPCRILITTSVLDNGVSVEDENVSALLVCTESRTSFIQMLGRIREVNKRPINLYLTTVDSVDYERRAMQLKKIIDIAERSPDLLKGDNLYPVLMSIYNNPSAENSQNYRRIYSLFLEDWDILDVNRNMLSSNMGVFTEFKGLVMRKNRLALNEMGDMFLIEHRFAKLAKENPCLIAIEQLSWIGKQEDDLSVLEDRYIQDMKDTLRKELLKVKNFSNEEFQNVKRNIAVKYGKTLLKDFNLKKQSFSKEKLVRILLLVGLELIETKQDNRIQYSIIESGSLNDSTKVYNKEHNDRM